MKVNMVNASVLCSALLESDIYDEFCRRVFDFYEANMTGEGSYPVEPYTKLLDSLDELMEETESHRKLSEEQANEGIKELLVLMDSLGFERVGITKLASSYPEGRDDFVKFLTQDVPLYMTDENGPEISNTTYLALFALLLMFYASSTVEPSGEALVALNNGIRMSHFIDHFRALDYQQDVVKLEDEYKNSKISSDVLKSIKPIDVSFIPEFILEYDDTYTLIEGNWYVTSDLLKAITATSQAAQTLETQDLEGGLTNSGAQTAAQIIEGFKLKRQARLNNGQEPDGKGNLEGDR